jgi:hypothetical protein
MLEPDGRCDRPHGMHNAIFPILRLFTPVLLIATVTTALAAPPAAEDRYVATRDAAIEKLSAIYDAGKFDDAAKKDEEAATADLTAQMAAILNESARAGFGPTKLNLGSFYKGDEGFGTLDGLRFEALLGRDGQKAGSNGADDKYVEPKAHIVVTTQTLFERWLHAHKEWWGDKIKNVPQQIAKALSDESFYTQAISNGSAVVKFSPLPITKPAGATFVFAMLAGRTQSELPDSADEVIVAAVANGKVYVAEGSIEPKVRIAACLANKKFEPQDDDRRQKSEDAYARCFAQRAPREASFAQATKQAQALLASALGK